MTVDEIKKEFYQLADEFNNSRGFACYEIGKKLTTLSTKHYYLTGKYLNKPKRVKSNGS